MLGLLLGWCTIYTFSGTLAPDRILPGAKFTLRSSLAFSYIGSFFCTALQQRASAKLRGVVQGMELQNFRRGRHLYWAGRPSRWASAHILVFFYFLDFCGSVADVYGDTLRNTFYL